MPLFTRRAVVLAKIESSEGVDATPTTAADAQLVSEPDFSPDIAQLTRNMVANDLGVFPHIIGRKLGGMTFGVDLRSNGFTDSGLLADVAKVGTLLKGCGMSETSQTTTGTIGPIIEDEGNVVTDQISWAATTGSGAAQPIYYDIECDGAGGSGIATVKITPDAQAIADAVDSAQTTVIITTATALDLKSGGSGAEITPTFSGDLSVGDKWRVQTYPDSIAYRPESSALDSLTLHMFLDGVRHTMVGCRGTFVASATAGELGTFTFTFAGQWVDPTDESLPTDAVYENQLPTMFELSKLRVDDFGVVINEWSFDAGNNVVARADSRKGDGYQGVQITGREPTGGIDPEMELLAAEDFWANMSTAKEMREMCRFGTVAGNTVWFLAPKVQYTGLSYQSRDDLRVLDAGLRYPRDQGNDDFEFLFS